MGEARIALMFHSPANTRAGLCFSFSLRISGSIDNLEDLHSFLVCSEDVERGPLPCWIAVALNIMRLDMYAGLWDCGEGEVHMQAQICGTQNDLLHKLITEWSQEAGCGSCLPT